MTNLEYLEKVKKAEEEWLDDEVIRNITVTEDEVGIRYREIKALEIIAEELVLAVRELKVLIKAVRGKI